MKLKRSFVYALLSLLLVLSQQMGITHAVSHLADATNSKQTAQQTTQQISAQDLEASPSKKLALDQSCDQCLAFAQIAHALDSPSHTFPVASHMAPVSIVVDAPLACQRTVCVFQSRAPPSYA